MQCVLSNTDYPLKYLSCGNLISKKDFIHNRRTLDIYVLIMIKEGTLYISQSGVNYVLGPNEYLLLKANEEHYGYKASQGKLSYMWVHFLFHDAISMIEKEELSNELLRNIREGTTSSQYIIPVYGKVSLNQRAPLLFNQLMDLSRQEILYSNQMLDFALSLLMMEISQEFIEMHCEVSTNISPKISLIMEWIRTNYFRTITIGEIANEFGYNPDYISSLFKKNTGTSLIYYINKTRIDISKTLLSNYDLSIKETAYSCGFSDEKYFMKTFKKLEGMTPAQYKKAFIRKMIN